MAVNSEDFELGPAQVTFDGTDLGGDEGDTTVTITTDSADLLCNQLGSQPANKVIIGRGATVKVPMAEVTLANFLRTLPGTRLVTDAMDSTKKKLVLAQGIGSKAIGTSGLAKQIVVKPYVDGVPSTDATDGKWFTFPKSFPVSTFELPYNRSGQRVLMVEFAVLPDPSHGNILGWVGDTTAAS